VREFHSGNRLLESFKKVLIAFIVPLLLVAFAIGTENTISNYLAEVQTIFPARSTRAARSSSKTAFTFSEEPAKGSSICDPDQTTKRMKKELSSNSFRFSLHFFV
jgi:hypothetical protein